VGNLVAFSTDGQVWVTDGTVAGTRRILQMAANERVYSFARFGDAIYFVRNGDLWRSDGTASGTAVAVPSSVAHFSAVFGEARGRLFLSGNDGVFGLEPWVSDGSVAGTHLLADLIPGPHSPGLGTIIEVDAGVLLFDSLSTMWLTHGTAGTTTRVRALSRLLGRTGSRHVWLDGTPGLFRSDGTVAGTTRILPHRYPGAVVPRAGMAMAAVDDDVHGSEPWVVHQGAIAEPRGHGCNGIGMPSRLRVQDPVLGATIALIGDSLPSGSAAAVLLGGALPFPLVEQRTGCAVYLDPNRIVAVLATLTVGREYRTGVRIPLTPSASGVTLAAQAVLFPGYPPLGYDLSNAATMTLGR
jgi:ELWxxDGT repeat protein